MPLTHFLSYTTRLPCRPSNCPFLSAAGLLRCMLQQEVQAEVLGEGGSSVCHLF